MSSGDTETPLKIYLPIACDWDDKARVTNETNVDIIISQPAAPPSPLASTTGDGIQLLLLSGNQPGKHRKVMRSTTEHLIEGIYYPIKRKNGIGAG